MIGVIKSYNTETESGTITIGKEDFQFEISDWIANAPPEQGDNVKFDLRGLKPININLYAVSLDKSTAVKRKYIAILLAFFFGYLGAHRIYLGFYRLAIIQMITSTLLIMVAGLPGYAFLWGFVEAILLFGGHIDKDALGRPIK